MAKAWVKWESGFPQSFDVPRSLAVHREKIEEIGLYSFGDARHAGEPSQSRKSWGPPKGSRSVVRGANCIANLKNWPADILEKPTEQTQAEAKLVRKVLAVAVDEEDEIENVLRKFNLQKAVRVRAWMRRLAHSAVRSRGRTRIEGPLTTQETNQLRLHWERQAQKSGEVEKDRVALNLQLNQKGLLECRGLPSVFTRNQSIFPANRGRSPPSNFAWESGANDDQSSKPMLDP